MACDLKILNNYGDGSLGAVSNPTGQLNSYANVTAYTANSITIGTAAAGAYETFAVGKEIMLHVSATNGTSQDVTYLGKYLICKITAVNGGVLTVDKDFTAILPAAQLTNYIVQAITIAQLQSFTLSSGSITPPAFSVTNKYGGILLAKCTDTATFSGGSINLVDKGIPAASTAYRPKTAQELQGTADTDKYSGWENHITLRQFLLNAGDGAAMIIAKHFVQTGTASRIGGTTAGAQFTRGTIGGSTIALIAGDITGFDPSIISKNKGSGQGLGRCYIASDTKLRNDEGLYAYDCISNPYRLMRTLNIKNYGDGSLGDVTNPTAPMNNYAKVTAISTDGKTITYSNKTSTGMAQIATGSLVMFHVSKHADPADMSLLGKFVLAKVLSDDGNNLILDTAITGVFDAAKLSKYSCQIISVAQFNNLTISTNYTATAAWNDTNKIGGICAIAAKGKIDITGGQINVENKGGGTAYARAGLAFIGNAQMADILPIGQGHGSVFLLTSNLKADANSKVGATHNATLFGGNGTQCNPGSTGGYVGNSDMYGRSGGGGAGISSGNAGIGYGGMNGIVIRYLQYFTSFSKAGSHIFIVADTINLFSLQIANTGATGSTFNYCDMGIETAYPGGAGYGSGGSGTGADGSGGSGGGYNGGGAGINCNRTGSSSGWAFVYANNITSNDTTGVVI